MVASNRGPVSFTRDGSGRLTARRGGGGVVSGLSSVAGRADLLWVCAALSEPDRAAARAAPGGLLGPGGGEATPDAGAVRMLDIPAGTFGPAYNTIANSVLWFVHHMLYDTPRLPQFGLEFRRDWEAYRAYNAAFADAIAGACAPAAAGDPPTRVLVQDYHLALVPRMLADRGAPARVAHFSHTPWAPPDYFRMLPDDIAAEVLGGILGADHAGFLCQRWADAFADCCERLLGARVDRARCEIVHRGHRTSIGVHPLGVDAAELAARAAESDVTRQLAALAAVVGDRKLIVRVDRTELSKNIVRGLAAYRELLRARPQWRGKVMLLAFAYPSRREVPEYREYFAAAERLAAQIAEEFAAPGWSPVLLDTRDDYPRSLAGYRLADVLLVNPIRDGMNLVAKEGPVLSGRDCVLVLSREAGAAAELGEHALLVNPFDVTGTAEALHRALTMAPGERAARRARLAQAAAAVPPSAWFASLLAALGEPAAPAR